MNLLVFSIQTVFKSLRHDSIKRKYRQRKRREPKIEPWSAAIVRDREEQKED